MELRALIFLFAIVVADQIEGEEKQNKNPIIDFFEAPLRAFRTRPGEAIAVFEPQVVKVNSTNEGSSWFQGPNLGSAAASITDWLSQRVIPTTTTPAPPIIVQVHSHNPQNNRRVQIRRQGEGIDEPYEGQILRRGQGQVQRQIFRQRQNQEQGKGQTPVLRQGQRKPGRFHIRNSQNSNKNQIANNDYDENDYDDEDDEMYNNQDRFDDDDNNQDRFDDDDDLDGDDSDANGDDDYDDDTNNNGGNGNKLNNQNQQYIDDDEAFVNVDDDNDDDNDDDINDDDDNENDSKNDDDDDDYDDYDLVPQFPQNVQRPVVRVGNRIPINRGRRPNNNGFYRPFAGIPANAKPLRPNQFRPKGTPAPQIPAMQLLYQPSDGNQLPILIPIQAVPAQKPQPNKPQPQQQQKPKQETQDNQMQHQQQFLQAQFQNNGYHFIPISVDQLGGQNIGIDSLPMQQIIPQLHVVAQHTHKIQQADNNSEVTSNNNSDEKSKTTQKPHPTNRPQNNRNRVKPAKTSPSEMSDQGNKEKFRPNRKKPAVLRGEDMKPKPETSHNVEEKHEAQTPVEAEPVEEARTPKSSEGRAQYYLPQNFFPLQGAGSHLEVSNNGRFLLKAGRDLKLDGEETVPAKVDVVKPEDKKEDKKEDKEILPNTELEEKKTVIEQNIEKEDSKNEQIEIVEIQGKSKNEKLKNDKDIDDDDLGADDDEDDGDDGDVDEDDNDDDEDPKEEEEDIDRKDHSVTKKESPEHELVGQILSESASKIANSKIAEKTASINSEIPTVQIVHPSNEASLKLEQSEIKPDVTIVNAEKSDILHEIPVAVQYVKAVETDSIKTLPKVEPELIPVKVEPIVSENSALKSDVVEKTDIVQPIVQTAVPQKPVLKSEIVHEKPNGHFIVKNEVASSVNNRPIISEVAPEVTHNGGRANHHTNRGRVRFQPVGQNHDI